MHYVNPTREQFKAIYEIPDGAPVCMLNLLRFREYASYEAAKTGGLEKAVSGRKTYERYSVEAEFAFRRAGGQQVWIGEPQITLTGPQAERWDLVFIAQYPTVKSFIDLVKSPEYQKATQHRTAALEDSRLIVCASLRAGPSFAPLSYLAAM